MNGCSKIPEMLVVDVLINTLIFPGGQWKLCSIFFFLCADLEPLSGARAYKPWCNWETSVRLCSKTVH